MTKRLRRGSVEPNFVARLVPVTDLDDGNVSFLKEIVTAGDWALL